jgi:PAS domain S-box-containing protein
VSRASTDVPATALQRLARRQLPALLLVLVLATSCLLLLGVETDSQVPVAWPAVGLLTGLLLVIEQHRGVHLALGGALLALAHLLAGHDMVSAVGLSVATVAGAAVAYARLRRGLVRRRVGLLEDGDVSRLIAAASQGAAVAAVLVGTTVAITGEGTPWLAAVAVLGTHAASQLVLVPLFVEGPDFEPLASSRERVVQSLILIGCTTAMFGYAAAPPLVFALMPMFAWLAFRGTLREATLLLTIVGAIASLATAFGLGPVHELGARYDLAPELVVGFLQLFLVDCALILLPLAVMTTQQRMSAARATTGRQTLQRLIDAATGSAVIATDLDGEVRVFNPGAEAVFGVVSADAVGTTADRLFSDEELARQALHVGCRPIFAEICATSTASGADERRLWQFRRPDGEERSVSMVVTAVPDERGGVAAYLCVAEDVTEREAMHASLLTALEHERSAVERLRELEQVKSDFVATVSHELRTPLTSMMGYVELLEDGAVGELTADQRAVANRVERNGRRLLLLVEDLLLLSQIETRQMSMNPVTADLRDTAAAAHDALGPLLATRHLDVVVRVPETPVMHQGDTDQLERMVLNLVGNAVKFTPDGGRVELVVSDRQDSVEVVVLDTGIGIPADEQDQLFTRFFRSSRATADAIQGTGLGLTIVQAIVALHGGEISVSSNEGIGTTVSVSLPKQLPAGVQSATPYRRSPASPSPGTM